MGQDFGSNSGGYYRNTLSQGPEYGYTYLKSPGRFYEYPLSVLGASRQCPLQPQTQFLSRKPLRAFIHSVLRMCREEGGAILRCLDSEMVKISSRSDSKIRTGMPWVFSRLCWGSAEMYLRKRQRKGRLLSWLLFQREGLVSNRTVKRGKKSRTGSRDSRVETALVCCAGSRKRGRRIRGEMNVY